MVQRVYSRMNFVTARLRNRAAPGNRSLRVRVEARSAADRLTNVGRGADQFHQRLPLLLRGAKLLARDRHLNLRLQCALLRSQDTLDGRIVHG